MVPGERTSQRDAGARKDPKLTGISLKTIALIAIDKNVIGTSVHANSRALGSTHT